jgi:hypothetical protein
MIVGLARRPIAACCFAFAVVVVAIATGCSGNASSPVPAPKPTTGFPIVDGASFTYLYTRYGVITAPNQTPQPSPTYSSTENVSVRANATFENMTGLADFRRSGSGLGQRWSLDEYFTVVPIANGWQLQEVAAKDRSRDAFRGNVTDSASSTAYSMPYVQVQGPPSTGRRWSQNAAFRRIFTEHSIRGQSLTDSVDVVQNADGSRSLRQILEELGVTYRGYSDVRSDGSVESRGSEDGCTTSETIGVPVRSNGRFAIPFTVAARGCPSPYPAPVATTIPDWYPGGGSPPSPLTNSIATDEGSVAIPASCLLPRSLPSIGEKIVTVTREFDPTGIIARTTQATYYVPNVGLACVQITATSDIYSVAAPAARLSAHSVFHETQSLVKYTDAGGAIAVPFAGEGATGSGIFLPADRRCTFETVLVSIARNIRCVQARYR